MSPSLAAFRSERGADRCTPLVASVQDSLRCTFSSTFAVFAIYFFLSLHPLSLRLFVVSYALLNITLSLLLLFLPAFPGLVYFPFHLSPLLSNNVLVKLDSSIHIHLLLPSYTHPFILPSFTSSTPLSFPLIAYNNSPS